MSFKACLSASVTTLLALCGPASADGLGFRFADISVAGLSADSSATGQIKATADFAITGAHGIQLDLGAVGYGGEFLGQIDGHFYMMPTQAAKYGLYFSLADMDGREATIASLGVEGMFALSDRTVVHGRAGLGMALPGNVDFITLSGGASHAFNDQVAVFGDVMLAEFDEDALRAVATTARMGISYHPASRPWHISASVVRDGLTGRNAAAFETRAEVAFTWHLGAGGGAKRSLGARAFASPQPFDAVLRRGLF